MISCFISEYLFVSFVISALKLSGALKKTNIIA
jgi:hypothetical protein